MERHETGHAFSTLFLFFFFFPVQFFMGIHIKLVLAGGREMKQLPGAVKGESCLT